MTAQTPSPRRAKPDGDILFWRDFLCQNPLAYRSLLEWIDDQQHRVLERLADPAGDLEQIPTLRGEYAALKRLSGSVTAPVKEEEALNAFKARAKGAQVESRPRDPGEQRAGGVRFRE